jgi:acyl dehydratase
MDAKAEGRTYPPVRFVVDPVRVAAFRSLFGIGDGVPPTFATAAEFAALPQVLGDPVLGLDFTRVVHGSQEYTYARPVREGETLEARARIDSIRHRGGTGFLTIVIELVDVEGQIVCTARSQLLERGPEG